MTKILSSQEASEEIERLKERVTALYEDDSAQEEADSLANRLTNWTESVAINADLIKSLQSEIERLKGREKVFADSLSEIGVDAERALELVEHNRQKREALSANTKADHRSLQEKVEKLKKKEDLNEQEFCAIRDVLREVKDHIVEESPNQSDCPFERNKDLRDECLVKLELRPDPNQSDCPLGYKCKEGKGHWYIPTEKSFEECGNTCPKKKDERADMIKYAIDLVTNCMDSQGKWASEGPTISGYRKILEALSIAEQSIKGGGE